MPFHERALGAFARFTDRFKVWHQLPTVLAVPTLLGHRANMRNANLLDVERDPSLLKPEGAEQPRDQRSSDGSYNDLACPWMGMSRARFGRNVPIAGTYGEQPPELYEPSPRVISRELLNRKTFIPVPYLNTLVSAWLQFMVHDWLSHGPGDARSDPHKLPLSDDDDWENKSGRTMDILRPRPDALTCPADTGQPTTYRNTETHWWDGSQIYGSSLEKQRRVRGEEGGRPMLADGKIALDERGLLPLDSLEQKDTPGLELAGVNGSWWLGLSVLHTIFAREHNAIVDALRLDHPEATGEWLFQKARLVNAALIAKIHTVEWTPALMNSPTGRFVMRGTWWGLMGEHYNRGFGRIGSGDLLSGVPGSETDHYAAPYAMTEEFTAVYRMHSLLPDDFSFRSAKDDSKITERDFTQVAGGTMPGLYAEVDFSDVLYSLGTMNPGVLTLHNYPAGLRKLQKEESDDKMVTLDLAAVDILRDRERGVPRYCEFRRRLSMRVPKTFAELTANEADQKLLERIYGTIDKVDLLVGMHCETSPTGFGFSDTAFRIFVLMASRRLKSDRFFTTDFRPEVYTPAGFAWVRDNSFRTVLERHFPALTPRFGDLRNVFFAWDRGRALMARSIRIPGLVDIKKVDDRAEIMTLSLDARLDRRFEPIGPLVNRFLMRRIRGALRVDGRPLPAVAPRGDAERAAGQIALRRRLEPRDGAALWDEATLSALAAAVRGDDGAPDIAPAAQQAVGRLFAADYVGDAASFQAARDLDDAIRTRNPFRSIQLKITGRLRRSRKLLAAKVNGDLAGVHATGIAVHNLVRGFQTMRDLWRRRRPRPSADEAVGNCLYAPETVVRQATQKGGTLAGDVRPGTLLLFQLDTVRAHAPGAEAVFMAGTWAECPAVAFVPALLRAVWERAVAEEGRHD